MKDPIASSQSFGTPQPRRGRSWLRQSVRVLLAAAIVILIWSWMVGGRFGSEFIDGAHTQEDGPVPPKSINGFRDIKPSTSLNWIPCYRSNGPLFCTRLTVPMDYKRPLEDSSNHPTVELALLMLPGKGHVGYGKDLEISPANFSASPLLINPGGPGGSGVDLVRIYGPHIQAVVGNDRDVIGFDPRGVGSSTPRSDCFLQATPGNSRKPASDQDALMRRVLFAIADHEIGFVNSSDVALAKVDARNRAVNKLCDAKDGEEGDRNILRYAGTPNVARDMLSIVHAWDAWQGVDSDSGTSVGAGMEEGKPNAGLGTRGKLVYWGFSYGTLLGATFSAMFPEKVGRVILDGVCDADHYVSPTWSDSLIDADAIWNHFFIYCHEAKEKCAFYHPSYSVGSLKARYQAIEDDIRADPIIVVTADKFPVLLTASDLRSLIFGTLYQPNAMYPFLARLLVMLEDRSPMSLSVPLPTQDSCLAEPETYPGDSTRAVMCGDKRYPLNQTLPELQHKFEKIAGYSQFADVWMTLMLMCSHYDIPVSDPPMRWGKRPSVQALPADEEKEEESVLSVMTSEKKIKTHFPLLLMTNTYDPVTPKAAAIKMTQKFEGARLLEQTALGHCTLSAASICTLMNVRKYIRDGILPEEPDFNRGKWIVCEADEHPWSPVGQNERAAEYAAEEISDVGIQMLESWVELQKKLAKDYKMPKYGQIKLSRGFELLLQMMDM